MRRWVKKSKTNYDVAHHGQGMIWMKALVQAGSMMHQEVCHTLNHATAP